MSDLPGGGDDFDLDLPNLPSDDLDANDLPMEVGSSGEDEIAINFVEDDDAPLRGQNEDAYDDNRLSAEELGDEDYATQEAVNRERSRRAAQQQASDARTEDLERRLISSEKQKIEVQRDSFKLALDSIDQRLDAATEHLKYARQEEDVSLQTDIEAQIRQLHQVRDKVETNANTLPDPSQLDAEYEQFVQSRRQRQAQEADNTVRPTNSLAEQWVKKNRWFNSDDEAKQSVLKVDSDLVAEGFDPNTPDYFRELSRRVAHRHKGLQVSDLSGQGAGERPQRGVQGQAARPVAGGRPSSAGRPGTSGGRGKTKVDITSSDRAMMKAVGIDTSDKRQVAAYAQSKLERIRKESLK